MAIACSYLEGLVRDLRVCELGIFVIEFLPQIRSKARKVWERSTVIEFLEESARSWSLLLATVTFWIAGIGVP
jgi:hypothetical protein